MKAAAAGSGSGEAALLDAQLAAEGRVRGVASDPRDVHMYTLAAQVPHFFYHVTAAYGILRNQGVQLTMGDFLGSWGQQRASA